MSGEERGRKFYDFLSTIYGPQQAAEAVSQAPASSVETEAPLLPKVNAQQKTPQSILDAFGSMGSMPGLSPAQVPATTPSPVTQAAPPPEVLPVMAQPEAPVNVDNFVLYKSLIGDKSDNIKGLPRVGKKTALKYISNWKL